MINETRSVAIIAGGFALAGSLITGWFTYYASAQQWQVERYKRRLVQAYRDITSFYRLEEFYTEALASEEKSREAWKRQARKLIRDKGFDSPSEDATAKKSEQRIVELE